MRNPRLLVAAFSLAAMLAATSGAIAQGTLAAANERLLQQMSSVLGLTPEQVARLRTIFAGSGMMGQGNPAVTQHPISEEQCRAKVAAQGVTYANPQFEKICGARFMAPLYNPATQKPEDADACIDQFEFPNMPCTYPVVWVRAREAAEICEAQGKRLCDAHEWEDACSGTARPADYDFGAVRGMDGHRAFNMLRAIHNQRESASRRWSYGPEYRSGVCATGSRKSPGCNGGSWEGCGSNTYPTGSFPGCRSELGVYDINGNAAEHMNLPTNPGEMASRGSRTLGYTEMKGSWFVWDQIRAHEDWCRWRAPYWHGTRVMAPDSHANYHLGFRCCKSLKD